ncbi:MAG: hypothetical protein ABR599_07245, partial [Gemmatimonadota bacterium]
MRRETAREGPLAVAARALLPIALAVPALLAARGPFLDAQESAVSATGAGQTPGARSPGAAPAGVVDVPLTAG